MNTARVALVTTGLGTGGAEHMLCKLAEQSVGSGIELRVISLRDEGSFGARIRAAGVPLTCCGLPRFRGVAGLLVAQGALRDFAPTAVQGWMYHGSLAANLFAARLPQRPSVFWSIRQTLYDPAGEPFITRQIIRRLANHSAGVDGVIYNSTLAREHHRAVGILPHHDSVIANGFDLARYRPDAGRRAALRRQLGISEDAVLVGIVARVHPMKDHGNFIAAAVALAAALPGVRFVLAGDGTEGSEMLNRLDAAGIVGRCSCLGRVDATEMLYPGLDLLLLSSAWGEAWPNVLGEAMACGVPCVATDVGDSRKIVGDAGRIVPPRDAAALASAARDLLGLAPAARMAIAAAARERVATRFGIAAVFEEYAQLWRGGHGSEGGV